MSFHLGRGHEQLWRFGRADHPQADRGERVVRLLGVLGKGAGVVLVAIIVGGIRRAEQPPPGAGAGLQP